MSGFDQRTPTFQEAVQGQADGVRPRPIVGERSYDLGKVVQDFAADFEDPEAQRIADFILTLSFERSAHMNGQKA
jgi:hypothetical protein